MGNARRGEDISEKGRREKGEGRRERGRRKKFCIPIQ
jgi:hypothetical protein